MPSKYEMPPLGVGGAALLGFMLEQVQEAQGWLNVQSPSAEWQRVAEMLQPDGPGIEGLSNLGYGLVQKNAREIVSSLSSFRHVGEFKPRFDEALYERAHMLTKLDRNWENDPACNVWETHRANLQNAVVWGTGYLVQDWDKGLHGKYGDIRLRAFAPTDVTFVQMPKNHDIQKAYMTLIREEIPINQARREYPNLASTLTPDRDAPGWIQKGLEKVQRLMGGSPVLRLGSMGNQNNKGSFPTVDIFHAYILDYSINETSEPIKMGTRGTNWSYTVPAIGDPLPTGIPNPATGQEWTRPAEEEDCRLYPLRRYCVFSRTGISYDGSSPWWHGQTPVARVRFNDWAWEALGRSMMGEPRTMQDGIIALMRLIEDNAAARLNPAMLYDDTKVSAGFANTFNPRMAGSRAAADINNGEVIKPALQSNFYDVPLFIPEYIKQQEQRINQQMGTPDLIAIAKAKQVPGEGTLEKLMEMAGPIVQDMIHALEMPLAQLGEWRKALYFQFYTIGRVIQTVGEDDTMGDEQYQPSMLVPDLEGETLTAKRDRTKRYLEDFKYVIAESGIHEMHRMVNRLALLQLVKAGVPIDWWTIAKAWKISNFGPEPEGTHNVMERWTAQQHLTRELAEEMGGIQGPPPQQGRPPTNAKPPQLVQKDGGTRSTVKTS
jgi:hypothetical protein